jgi:AcrR family transcriptional regulator
MRPKVPLISKRKVCEVALAIIDEEGIDALSIRRLARRLGVNGASLYHHFENKEDIVVGAALLALSSVRTPETSSEDWRVWFLRNTQHLKAALEQHPDLIPALIRRNALRLGLSEIDSTFALLEEQGLPIGLAWTLMETLESFVIGVVMRERTADGADDAEETYDAFPHLRRATTERMLSNDEAFVLGCQAIIDGIAQAAESAPRRPAAKRAGAKKVGRATTVTPRRASVSNTAKTAKTAKRSSAPARRRAAG